MNLSDVDRDRSPIDQQWVQRYCDQFLVIAATLDGQMKDAVMLRVECVMDLLEAWQLRNVQPGERARG